MTTGTCTVTWWDDPATLERVLRLDRADLDIKITEELLSDLHERGWVGEGVFIIEASNGTARYRLGVHNKQDGYWTAHRIGPDPTAR